jgi:tetratricopeptide (TPR) repeat protein
MNKLENRITLTMAAILGAMATYSAVSIMTASAGDAFSDLRKEVLRLETSYKSTPKLVASDYSTALFRLGLAMYKARDYKEAKEMFAKSDQVSGGSGSSNASWIADCCSHLGQYDEAEVHYAAALGEAGGDRDSDEMPPAAVSSTLGLADVYEHTGRLDQAGKLYREVAAQVEKMESGLPRPVNSPQSFDKLAQFLERKGDAKEAEVWWQKVANMNCNAHAYSVQADALDHYAAMLRKQKRDKEAAPLEKRAKDLRATQSDLDRKGSAY